MGCYSEAVQRGLPAVRPFITKCSQKKMRQINKDLRNGHTVKEAALIHGIAENTVSKYERIYNTFGYAAFAKHSETGRKCAVTKAVNKRARG